MLPSVVIGSFTALEPVARRAEEALADVCSHDKAAISCLQALPFASLQPTGKARIIEHLLSSIPIHLVPMSPTIL